MGNSTARNLSLSQLQKMIPEKNWADIEESQARTGLSMIAYPNRPTSFGSDLTHDEIRHLLSPTVQDIKEALQSASEDVSPNSENFPYMPRSYPRFSGFSRNHAATVLNLEAVLQLTEAAKARPTSTAWSWAQPLGRYPL